MLATTQIPIVVGKPPVTVTTDKLTYNLGDPVQITVKNGLDRPIYFNNIMVKNLITGKTTMVEEPSCPPNAVCPAIANARDGPIKVEPRQSYKQAWYPQSKGYYQLYIDWWAEGTVTCMAIGCPLPKPGISDRSYSNRFWVR